MVLFKKPIVFQQEGNRLLQNKVKGNIPDKSSDQIPCFDQYLICLFLLVEIT